MATVSIDRLTSTLKLLTTTFDDIQCRLQNIKTYEEVKHFLTELDLLKQEYATVSEDIEAIEQARCVLNQMVTRLQLSNEQLSCIHTAELEAL
ncbi:hypothetical protein PCE1_001904 [Barthelona sp. PCE]